MTLYVLRGDEYIAIKSVEELITQLTIRKEETNWSDRKLARKINMQHTTVTRILTRETQNPSMQTIFAMMYAMEYIKF